MWYKEKVSEEEIASARAFIKPFGARLHFKSVIGGGQVHVDTGLIEMSKFVTRNSQIFWSILLHELCHCICFQKKLYYNYHNLEPSNTKELRRFRRIAYKAERFVDKMAAKMMEDYFPGMPYKYQYFDKHDKKWFYEEFLDRYYKELR